MFWKNLSFKPGIDRDNFLAEPGTSVQTGDGAGDAISDVHMTTPALAAFTRWVGR